MSLTPRSPSSSILGVAQLSGQDCESREIRRQPRGQFLQNAALLRAVLLASSAIIKTYPDFCRSWPVLNDTD